jgi:hypothetical protein
MASTRNIAIVALMQLGVILIGILLASFAPPNAAAFLRNFGPFGLLIPLIWAVSVVVLNSRTEDAANTATWTFWFGILMLIGLVVLVVYLEFMPQTLNVD